MNIGIIGVGEVGSAVKRVVEKKYKVFTKDLANDGIKGQHVEILHVCIPYSNEFVKIIVKAVKDYKPSLVIIESTVVPGTTDVVYRRTKTLVCHSPVRGVHPNLYKGITTFVKYIGPTSKKAGMRAQEYYKKLGLKTEIFKDAKTSEIAKLMDTTYYGWNIVFQKEIYKICRKYNISFEEAYTKWNCTYNQGYTKLKMPNVVRPVLKNYQGKIGGHCIIPNCKLLEGYMTNPISKSILRFNKTY